MELVGSFGQMRMGMIEVKPPMVETDEYRCADSAWSIKELGEDGEET